MYTILFETHHFKCQIPVPCGKVFKKRELVTLFTYIMFDLMKGTYHIIMDLVQFWM